MKHQGNAGYTVVELIVSLVILGVVISLGATSFKLFTDRLEKKHRISPVYAVHFSWLLSSINSLLFYSVESKEDDKLKEEFYFYFEGTGKTVSYISKAAITKTRQFPVIHTLEFLNGQIVLFETDLYSNNQNYLDPAKGNEDSKMVVLFDEVKDLNLTYKINNQFVQSLTRRIPESIRMEIEFKNSLKTIYDFNIKSNFVLKKNLTYDARHPEI